MSDSESSDNPDVIDLNETNSTETPETEPSADEEPESDTEATDEPAGEEEAEPDTTAGEADEEESVSDSEADSEATETEADAEAEPTGEDPDETPDTADPDEDPEGGESNNNPAPDSADEDMSESEPPEQSDDEESASESPSASSEAFKAIIEAGDFQDSLDSVSVLVDECKVHLTEDGFSITAVDPANVAMVDLNLEPAAFEHYVADGGVIGVNLSRFKDIISMASSGDLIHLHLDEKTRKLNIEFDGLSYTLALIDPDSIRQEPDIPDLNLPSTTVLEGSQINRGITAADMVSDHIRLRVDESEEAFYIEAEGDTDDVDLKLERDDLIDMSPGAADSLYSLDYLKDMNKAFPKKAEITAELGEEFPVKFHYGLAEGHANVTYMLAPRIQSD